MKYSAVLTLSAFLAGCSSKTPLSIQSKSEIAVTPMRWHDNHRGVVTLTYDQTYGSNVACNEVVDAVVHRNLRMDFEMVTEYFDKPENHPLVDKIRNVLIPEGIHFFGHGHRHISYDALPEDSAYTEFKKCFDLMKQWGLHPASYAYPGCAGYLEKTQRACRQAGFLCARGVTYNSSAFTICPYGMIEPFNWYFLPSVPIAAYAPRCVHSHEEISGVLDEALDAGAWVILMYHSIGNPLASDYYPFDDFCRDLDKIRNSDLWCANMESAVEYIKERNSFGFNVQAETSDLSCQRYRITFCDGRDNEIFDQPLTVRMEINSAQKFSQCWFTPPIVSGNTVEVVDNAVMIDVLPDERPIDVQWF
jgi:hypothetical protein